MYIEKSISIDKSKREVFEYLKYTKHQDQFSVWNMTDPNKTATYIGTDGTIGFIYNWDSKNKNVGAGSQEIISIDKNEQITYEVRFDRPMKNIAQSQFILKEITPNKTELIWTFRGPTKFPMSLLKSLFQKMLGKDISKSLGNIKIILEK